MTFPPETLAVPCVAPLTEAMESVWPDSLAGPFESFPVRSLAGKLSGLSSVPDLLSEVAVGLSLTSVTVTLTVEYALFASSTPFVVPSSRTV